MKQIRVPGLIDVIKLDNPHDILQLTSSDMVDRQFQPGGPLLNRLMLGGILRTLSWRGQRFPTMRARAADSRATAQDQLWQRLNAQAPQLRGGPERLEPLANWLRGKNEGVHVGQLLQQVIGDAVVPGYVASPESWAAAMTMAMALAPGNTLTKLRWMLSGRVRRAKTLLAHLANNDTSAMHATGVAIHNIVKGMQQMRAIYQSEPATDAATAARRCLFAPAAVLRQAASEGSISGCPFSRRTLLVLELEKARQAANDEAMVFLAQTWSRCPADGWVPALFEGVWKRASPPH
ncbi:hypothetical protein GJ697_11515 [Pseudoduganella sp. FT25W]|uniref:Uncharacterized protein n=1 Tax=Duganella alba TaxID=2666081 RepID=A0A6L5QFG6_9BURK|nr:hypothetical protein [Duganella alba]MRX08465.1 hypothetical protein [Duganella alba]MRX17061.1 hypothetical protein [Duganella alba]